METQFKTPYEKYLLQGIAEEKKHLDSLYDQFARTSSVNKRLLKRKIDKTLENIDLLGRELAKYGYGLSWLREPSKERDEKAEHLEKIAEEQQAAPAAPAPAKPAVGGARPTIGTPVGAKPSVGTPAGAKPTVGSPVASRPSVGVPVGKPTVGTPAQPSTQQPAENAPAANTATSPPTQPSGRPRIGKPLTEEKS
ncbi:MAG: hypothetical protein JRN15_04750 [Nitrososphaerota archaeon]|nr:hypothetical protein [Nitrososphaerota archaeon]